MVIAFNQVKEIECLVIPDERCAGYFALGLAQHLQKTVALVCTSGTAVLNLSPAVCEAYYQQIPLLILTADRPPGAEKNRENQAIRQDNIFGFFASSISINGDAQTDRELKQISKETLSIFNNISSASPIPGHINVHLNEPLYNTTSKPLKHSAVSPTVKENYHLKSIDKKKVIETLNRFSKLS